MPPAGSSRGLVSSGGDADTAGVDDLGTHDTPLSALQRRVRELGADDLLLFRRVGASRLAHLGGCGRGEGWAGIVEVTDSFPYGGPGSVERREFPAARQILGPYHAKRAVLVYGHDELVVLGGRDDAFALDLPDEVFLAVAAQAAAAVTHVSPAKRLGDELEVLHAVQDLVAIDAGRPVPEVLAAVGASSASALSCEIAVLVVPGLAPVVVRTAPGGPGDEALVAAVGLLLTAGTVPTCSQEALERPLPGAPEGVRSWLLVPLDEHAGAGLLLVHTDRVARGFTQLCQEMGLRLAEAARSVIATALSRARLLEETRTLREAAERDALTGLGNRAAWERRLDDVQAHDDDGGVGVIICDLDDLKLTNDRLGHAAGDDLLRGFAAVLQSSCPTEHLVRLGGDEFAVLVLGGRDTARQRRDAILATLAAAAPTPDGERLRASVGWCWSANPQGVRACQRSADADMYDVKRHSRRTPRTWTGQREPSGQREPAGAAWSG